MAAEQSISNNGSIFSPNASHLKTQEKASIKCSLCSMYKEQGSSHWIISEKWHHNLDKASPNRSYKNWSIEQTQISMVWSQSKSSITSSTVFSEWSLIKGFIPYEISYNINELGRVFQVHQVTGLRLQRTHHPSTRKTIGTFHLSSAVESARRDERKGWDDIGVL